MRKLLYMLGMIVGIICWASNGEIEEKAVVISDTHQPELLDADSSRPGRFDRQVTIHPDHNDHPSEELANSESIYEGKPRYDKVYVDGKEYSLKEVDQDNEGKPGYDTVYVDGKKYFLEEVVQKNEEKGIFPEWFQPIFSYLIFPFYFSFFWHCLFALSSHVYATWFPSYACCNESFNRRRFWLFYIVLCFLLFFFDFYGITL